ncbi:MAG: hypothetical protein Q8Q56_01620 [Alphaproteobacteria bacterium]|nr:hypothetical protein [Alphaproteobacteria bacterium]
MKIIFSIISSISIAAYLGMFHLSANQPSTEANQPTQQDNRLKILHELFTTIGVKVDPTYEAMNSFAQMYWLRSPNKERWEIENSIVLDLQADKIIAVLRKLGMIERIDPSIKNPDYAIILGASFNRMSTRMQHMIELISIEQFTPKQIVVLTGDRPLDPFEEPPTILMEKAFTRNSSKNPNLLPKNESEAAKFVWDQLQKSDQVKNIPIVFLPTPMLKKNGKLVRPTTEDSVHTWLKTSPKPGSIVAFSNNPYIPYQNETIKPALIKSGWFKHGGTLETVGLAFTPKDNDHRISNCLDNVARYIYSILEVKKALGDSK